MRCLGKINAFLLELYYFTGYLGNETSLITGLISIEAAQNWALTFTFIHWVSSPTSPNQVEKKIIEQSLITEHHWLSCRGQRHCSIVQNTSGIQGEILLVESVLGMMSSDWKIRRDCVIWHMGMICPYFSLWLHLLPLLPVITQLAFLLFLNTNFGPIWGILNLFLPETFFPQLFSNTPSPHSVLFSNVGFLKRLSLMILFKRASPPSFSIPLHCFISFHRLITVVT